MFRIQNHIDIHFSDAETGVMKIVYAAAQKMQVPVYLVGGYVRDKILNRESKDIDFMCVGDGIGLAHLVADLIHPKTNVAIFKHYGTAKLSIGDLDLEFVGARKESYQSHSRNPLVDQGSLEDDLQRRDFTINALAVQLLNENEGMLIDQFNGLDDLKKRIIKTPCDPDITFSDDPLRMMRAVRFASQLNFEIHPATMNALRHNAARISIITTERITEELNKIILSDEPSRGFLLLHEAGILKLIFPEFTALCGVEMAEGKGHKDNFYHTLQVLDNISLSTKDLWIRWAAVLHDIAKPKTKRFEPGHGWTFHGHDALGARMVTKIFRRMRLPMNEKMKLVEKLVFLHLRPISLSKENITDSAIRRLLFEAGEDIEALMMLCEADITSKNKQKVLRYLQNFELVKERMKIVEENDHIRNWQPPITGEIIMETFKLSPCRMVGDIKTAVKDAILDGIIPNNYEAAFEYMIQKGAEYGLSANK
jgi:putative nucleotidyltransferase with HDIG domain